MKEHFAPFEVHFGADAALSLRSYQVLKIYVWKSSGKSSGKEDDLA